MILHFESNNVTGRLEGRVPIQVLDAVEKALTYKESGFYFSPAYKLGHWDGTRCLFKRKTQEFPAGLESRIIPVLERDIPDYTLKDERTLWRYDSTLVDNVSLNGVELYQEQRDALHAFFSTGAQGCMELPTNFGKTEVAAGVLKIAGGKSLVIMDSASLMSQTAHRLRLRLQEKVGRYGAGYHETQHRVTVATVQALWHSFTKLKKEFLPSIKTLIVDEAHKVSPKMWYGVLANVHANVRLGLSATIKEASRRMVIESYLGPIVHEQSAKEMIDDGRAAKPTIRMVRHGGIIRSTDPMGIYQEGVVTRAQRNDIFIQAVKRCIALGKPPLVLVVRIEHGQIIQDILARAGTFIPFLHGQTPLDEIEDAKDNLGSKRVPGIIASTIFDMGQNMPEIRALLLAGAQRSPLRVIQRVGRSLRKKDEDNTVIVMDIYDMTCRMLQSQADDRFKTFKSKYGRESVKLVATLDEVFGD